MVGVDVDSGRDGDVAVELAGVVHAVKVLDPHRQLLAQVAGRKTALASGPTAIRVPMPGKVVKLLVKTGDRVTRGQPVAVVEAMKMENEVRAPRDGAVEVVHVAEGQAVEANEPLVTLSAP